MNQSKYKILKTIAKGLATHIFLLFVILIGCQEQKPEHQDILHEMQRSLRHDLLDPWYPMAVDTAYGGFLTSFTHDWRPTPEQDKMIVSQARHVWTNSKASLLYVDTPGFRKNAAHGYTFLKEVMWDEQFGGFHTLVSQSGFLKSNARKTAYGNAFGIYALAAYAEATNDPDALQLARQTFFWLEKHSHDPKNGGYFQHMERDGTVIRRDNTFSSTSEVGYKDQNSSIHLLEAFTALYQLWKDPLLKERLQELFFLVRDTLTSEEGFLRLFFDSKWNPLSFQDSTAQVVDKHHYLDHVSFGHDVETAYLLLEAAQVLAMENDSLTLIKCKKMMDHALNNGWDKKNGGFYDGGYYFKHESTLRIVRETKNWWAQAEGLNSLLLMAEYFPDDEMAYEKKFQQQWNYIKKHLIDHENGGWYFGGTDKEPQQKTALKGNMWKSTYHNFRALDNCIKRLKVMKTTGLAGNYVAKKDE